MCFGCMMTSKEHLIYLAGLIDGEGCLTFSKDNGRYRPQLRLTSIYKPVLDWVKMLFGGNYYEIHRKYPPYSKTSYDWVLSTNQAIDLVKNLLPYLKIKRKEAKVFISFYKVDKETSKKLAGELSNLKHILG